MVNALDEIGVLLFRCSAMVISVTADALAPLCKKSLQRTELRGYAKGYRQIADGKIKLPDAVKPKLRQMTILVFASLLIDPTTNLLKALFLRG